MAALRSPDNLARRLLSMKEQLQDKQKHVTELQGALKSVMRQLKEEFGVKTLEDAETLLQKSDAELKSLEAEFEQQVEKIEGLMRS